MKDEHKTKQQLIDELSGLRQRIDRLKTSEAQFMRAEEEMRKSYDTQRALNFLLSLSLEGTSLEEFLKRALRLILSIPWLAFESKGCIFLRAGVGWRKGLAGKAIVPADSDSQAGYTLLSSGPVIVDDLSTETRFKGPQLLIDHDVASGISVIIHDKDRHYGVMGAHTRKKRKFSEDDINFLQSVANIMTNVIERRKAEGSAICTSGGREERLQSSEKKLREITSALGEGVYVVNEHGRLIFMNPEAERLLGWKEAELLDKNVHEIIHYCRPNETPLSAEHCPVLKVIRTGEKYITEDDMFIRKDGTMFPVAYISTPMIEDGRIVGSITAFRNITLRKKMEDELINVKKNWNRLPFLPAALPMTPIISLQAF
ncbi:PAS domain S-box protein [Dissulfurispira sp.]|uniref:PAS domain S-box protein n=1 Tax=Dissulfurispira sp. TaxID=2817609 RepID=UPI002FDAB14A